MKAGAVALIATFMIGLIVGIQSGGEPEVRYKVIHDTETVTETVEVPVLTTPAGCADVVYYAQMISDAGDQFDITTSALLDVMSKLRIAVASGDSNAANDLETRLRGIQSKTTGAIRVLGTSNEPLSDAAKECLQ